MATVHDIIQRLESSVAGANETTNLNKSTLFEAFQKYRFR